MEIGAGDLRDRIEIQRATDVPDGAGGATRTWATFVTVWAKATPTGGKEGLIAGTLQQVQGWRVQMRFRADVTAAERFVLGGRPLNILSIEDPDRRRKWLVAFCEAEAS